MSKPKSKTKSAAKEKTAKPAEKPVAINAAGELTSDKQKPAEETAKTETAGDLTREAGEPIAMEKHEPPIDAYFPGQDVQASGIYRQFDAQGDATDLKATLVKGEPFPPTIESGCYWMLEWLTSDGKDANPVEPAEDPKAKGSKKAKELTIEEMAERVRNSGRADLLTDLPAAEEVPAGGDAAEEPKAKGDTSAKWKPYNGQKHKYEFREIVEGGRTRYQVRGVSFNFTPDRIRVVDNLRELA